VQLSRLATCIDKGVDAVKSEQEVIRRHVETVAEVAATLDPGTSPCARREADYQKIFARIEGDGDAVHEHMAKLMTGFRVGLFVGGDTMAQVQDNLELERWFRLPKSHERRIHGRRHAGVRLVQEGPTLVLALDAHQAHSGSFHVEDLFAYRRAREPACQRRAMGRRKIMRKARSKTKRPKLLAELERQYLAVSSRL
jgi:hypothetical protein